MKIVMIFNRYRFRGGEDHVFEAESALLEKNGHQVTRLVAEPLSVIAPMRAAINAIWSNSWTARLREILECQKPDLVHVHNWFPSISPAVFRVCHLHNVATVFTLHNYRLLCPAATFYRHNQPCEICITKKIAWRGIQYGCYHGSRIQTAGVAAAVAFHRWLGTWKNCIDVYICLTEFARQKFISAGWPAERLTVKPNFVYPEPDVGTGEGGYALFVGRLSSEKGVDFLLEAWERLPKPIPLWIVGDGPMAPAVQDAAAKNPNVKYLGPQPRDRVIALMQRAAMLVCPSQWYEMLPTIILEGMACGLPIVATKIGAIPQLVEHGRVGRLFSSGDPSDLVSQVVWLLENPQEAQKYRREARVAFEKNFTAERNYQKLMEIYALAHSRRRPSP